MAKSHWGAGNCNLRGKREMLLSCRCCTVTDLRDKFLKERHRKEMRDPGLNS